MASQNDSGRRDRSGGSGKRAASGFGPFLEQISKLKAGGVPFDLESQILMLLAKHQALDMAEMVRETRAPLSALLHSLQQLRDFGLISAEGGAGNERFSVSLSGTDR